MNLTVLEGDAIERLREMPDCSVQCCVTSPPYWGLRDYGTAEWTGGDADCDHLRPPGGGTKASGLAKYPNGLTQETIDAKVNEKRMQYAKVCEKCGAERVDKQIGLEETPAAFVAKLTEVFREVRRVLKQDGTCWVNLGDSYHTSGAGSSRQGTTGQRFGRRHTQPNLKSGLVLPGLKPKDLVGIPWRVAFALQQPYYSGRIKRLEDRVWLAAMLDAEGCMFIHKRKVGQSNGQGYERKSDNYASGLEISNTHESVVLRCMEIAGVGSICTQEEGRRQKLFRWNVRTTECRELMRELYPHLVAKQRQARIAYGCPSSGPVADACHQSLILLHRGATTTVDMPAPPSCFEQGWYLRSDVIWAKSNPMPESVTDRPTKAHEYLFLLTKSERYYYDAAAIREKSSPSTHARLSQNVQAQVGSARANGGAKTNGAMKDVCRKTGTPANGVKDNASFDSALAIMPEDRNKRTVWTVPTFSFSEAHFATFPPDLIKPCVLAGSRSGDVVLDPFGGSGTTGAVALELGRSAVLIELNPEYVELIRHRCNITPGLAL